MSSNNSTLNAAQGEALAKSALTTIETTSIVRRKSASTVTPPKLADFEEAIAATGYGYFNMVLMLIAFPAAVASVFEAASTSYIIPSAECDLQLSLMDKGILNAISYAGMVTSAIPWGYAADIFGRRQLLVYGLLLDSICMLCSSLAQNVWALMVFKYLGGLIMCGPFAVLMSYVSEFHGTKYRPSVMMIIGGSFSLATISLPVIAWLVIPSAWSLHIGSVFTMHSWQMFLSICAVPSILGSLGMFFMSESPKFLMSQGRNEEALQVMQTIFRWNTGKPRSDYPIKALVNELHLNASSDAKVSALEQDAEGQYKTASLSNGLSQMLPLLHKPLVGKCCLVLTIQLFTLAGVNTMRLWLPQLYTMVSNFDAIAPEFNLPYEHNLCGMIAFSVNQSVTNMNSIAADGYCEVAVIQDSMYLNTIYSGLTGLFGYLVAGAFISWFGAKNVLISGLTIVACCGMGLVWATDSLSTVILSSVYVSLSSICTTALIGVIVNIFPTSLRTMTISVAMMSGRLGALMGNLVFPYLLSKGCVPAFMTSGVVMLSLLCIALPNTRKTALK